MLSLCDEKSLECAMAEYDESLDLYEKVLLGRTDTLGGSDRLTLEVVPK